MTEQAIKTTVDEVQLPFIVQMMNRAGDLLDKVGIRLVDFSADSLIAAAERETGLSDWGDENFRPELKIMVQSYHTDAQLTLLGRISIKGTLMRWLSNKLLAQRDFKEHPEILESPIRRPLFVTGLPRTGTTLLHRLLSQDPCARVPLLWELMWPSPSPTKETRETDPRIAEAEKIFTQFLKIAQEMRKIHSLDPREPEECIWLMEQFFSVVHGKTTSYLDWFLEQDLTPLYQNYRKQLQLLQWRYANEHWTLKTPFHLFALDAILKVFPDACIVQTHRDPQTVLASYTSLIAAAYKIYSDHVDLKELGQFSFSFWETAVKRAMKVRATADPARFHDVLYEDLMADPVGVVRRIYDQFGYDFTPEFEQNIKAWLDKNPQNKHGVHHYSLEQFGLDKQAIKQHFADYIQTYHVNVKA